MRSEKYILEFTPTEHKQIHACRLLEIRKADLSVAVSIHSRPPSARFLTVFELFPCTYYTESRALCLDITAFFDCSGDIILIKEDLPENYVLSKS